MMQRRESLEPAEYLAEMLRQRLLEADLCRQQWIADRLSSARPASGRKRKLPRAVRQQAVPVPPNHGCVPSPELN